MIAAILHALVILFDADHCARYVTSHGALVCAEVRLDAVCAVRGWHEVANHIPVCVVACDGGEPTS